MKIYVVELNTRYNSNSFSWWTVHSRKRFSDEVKANMAVAELELGIKRWDLSQVLKVELHTEDVID